MKEIVLTKKKNGMIVLVLTLFAIVIAFSLMVCGGILLEQGKNPTAFIVGLVMLCIVWIPLCGLKVLKPQEALVLTLFGTYIGTIKGDGFFFVNPFCVAVNPAAKTKLNQSGDVTSTPAILGQAQTTAATNNKISLKIMTLNNNRQKINDCLGNPIEIGIAVTWRIVDTAQAVFNVDNYNEFLSLQCDSALRNVVRIYPYDVAPNVDTTGDGMADDLLAPLWSCKKTTVINDVDKLLFARNSWQGKFFDR